MHSDLRKRRIPACTSPLRVRLRGDPARVPPSGPLILRRERCHPSLHGPPLQARQLGSGLGTWQHSPLLGNTSSSPCDPSRSKLAPSQRWGMGWSYQAHTHTHTHTGCETKGKQSSAYSLEAAQTQSLSPWRVGQCLKLKAPPRDLKRDRQP